MKICSICKIEKEPTDFHRHTKERDGLSYWCRDCTNARAKTYYANRRHKKRIYNQANKDRDNQRKRLLNRKHTLEVFKLLGDKCALCPTNDRRLLQIDHTNGGGNKHRKSFNKARWGYLLEIKESILSGENRYRLLCANCNWLAAIENGHRKSIWHEEALGKL